MPEYGLSHPRASPIEHLVPMLPATLNRHSREVAQRANPRLLDVDQFGVCNRRSGRDKSSLKTLVSFNFADGATPVAALITDAAGG